MLTLSRCILTFAALAYLTPTVDAQQSAPLGSALVTLIAGTSPSRGGRTEVVRRAQRTPQNLVIVDRNATADDLAAALAMITALRIAHGDSLTTDLRARPESVRHGSKWRNSEYRKWLHEQLVRLRTATQSTFPGLGIVRSVQITLPAPARGFTASSGGRE